MKYKATSKGLYLSHFGLVGLAWMPLWMVIWVGSIKASILTNATMKYSIVDTENDNIKNKIRCYS